MNKTKSDRVLKAFEGQPEATAAQIAGVSGLSIREVSAALAHLISAGKVYHIGDMPISKHREVNLYALRPKAIERPPCNFPRQTWLSPIM